MPPRTIATIDSRQLGLEPGTINDLDCCLRQFHREHIVLRTLAVLNALAADRKTGLFKVNEHFAQALGGTNGALLLDVMRRDDGRFLEPLQQLVILRRSMTVCTDQGTVDIASQGGIEAYFTSCRLAADVANTGLPNGQLQDTVDTWLEVAAAFSTRIWLSNGPNPNHSIARMRLILDSLPALNPALRKYSDSLKSRFPEAIGLAYEDVATLVAFLSYWVLNTTWEELFAEPTRLRIDPDSWLSGTTVSTSTFRAFLTRVARPLGEVLSDDGHAGATSFLPFQDRPFVALEDGSVIPVLPELVVEKVTADVFWWVKAIDVAQDRPWQQDWGVLAEGYVLWLLESIARASNCEFARNVQWSGGELDAAIWSKGHVALVEITASSMSNVAAFSGDPSRFRAALRQTFVQSERPGKPVYNEAIMQLARDVGVLRGNAVAVDIPIANVQRVYPVVVALDRKLRVPGAWHYLNQELQTALGSNARECAGLAPLNVEDVESIEQLLYDRPRDFRGTPPGLLRILRRWDIDRGVAPSWWQFMEYVSPGMKVSRHLVAESAKWKQDIRDHFDVDPWQAER